MTVSLGRGSSWSCDFGLRLALNLKVQRGWVRKAMRRRRG